MADFHSPHASLSGFGEAYEAHIVEETRQIEKYARFGLMAIRPHYCWSGRDVRAPDRLAFSR